MRHPMELSKLLSNPTELVTETFKTRHGASMDLDKELCRTLQMLLDTFRIRTQTLDVVRASLNEKRLFQSNQKRETYGPSTGPLK